MCGIYKITNLINQKAYVGQAIDIQARFNGHKATAFNQNSRAYNYPLYRAIRKYGIENFIFEIVEECLMSELNEEEVYYIAYYNTYHNGYNQDEGGQGAPHYRKLSYDLVTEIIKRLKTSSDHNEIIGADFGVSERTIRGINNGETCYRDEESYPIRQPPMKPEKKENFCITCGAKINQKSKQHCTQCAHDAQRRAERPGPLELARMITEIGFRNVGKRYGVSDKAIVKWCKQYDIPHKLNELISWYDKQVDNTEASKPNRNAKLKMPVEQIDPETNKVIAVFPGVNDAARALGKTNGNQISKACNGKSKMAYGYLWRFASPSSTSNPAA